MKVSVTLAVAAPVAYDAFCRVERISEWLPHVQVLEVVRRYPSGLAELARFEATVDGTQRAYALHYVYDLAGLRVAWKTPAEEPLLFRGDALLAARGPASSELTYTFFERSDDSSLHHAGPAKERRAYGEKVAASFKAWVEAANGGGAAG
jgi:hypothetical protein